MSKSCLRKVNFVFAIELFVTDFVTGELDISLKRQKADAWIFCRPFAAPPMRCNLCWAQRASKGFLSRRVPWWGFVAFVSWPRASCPLCLGWGFVPSCLGWGLGASFWASAALVSWMGLRAFYEAFAAVVSWMGLDFLFLGRRALVSCV